jgi:type I restriction enzyme S subunit
MNIKQLRKKVLELAVSGKLVPQDPNDEPVLLESVANCHPELDSGSLPFEVPESWVWGKLDDILKYDQPTPYIVETTNYQDSFKTPVLTAGKTFILGYTDEKSGIYDNLPCIIFDDFTTATHYVDFKFKVKSSAMKILTSKSSDFDIMFAKIFIDTIDYTISEHKRQWISIYSQFPIPIPPLAEQKRIVAKVDEIFAVLDSLSLSLKKLLGESETS